MGAFGGGSSAGFESGGRSWAERGGVVSLLPSSFLDSMSATTAPEVTKIRINRLGHMSERLPSTWRSGVRPASESRTR